MKNSNTKFITLGEPMAMFTANQAGNLSAVSDYTRRIAGAELNVAIGMARLGIHSIYVTKVGSDSFGQYVTCALKAEGVDVSQCYLDNERPTAFLLKSKELSGADPTVEYFRKHSAASSLASEDCDLTLFEDNIHLHLTGVAAALSPSMRALCHRSLNIAKVNGNSVSFDTNLRPSLWDNEKQMIEQVNALAFKADIVLPGLGEGEILTGFDKPELIADFYLNQGVKLVVIKLGPDGAYYKTKDGMSGMVEPFKVLKVIDTVGAGDSFAVGVVSALLEGLPVQQAAKRGNFFGSLAVQVIGDNEGLPTLKQFNEYTL